MVQSTGQGQLCAPHYPTRADTMHTHDRTFCALHTDTTWLSVVLFFPLFVFLPIWVVAGTVLRLALDRQEKRRAISESGKSKSAAESAAEGEGSTLATAQRLQRLVLYNTYFAFAVISTLSFSQMVASSFTAFDCKCFSDGSEDGSAWLRATYLLECGECDVESGSLTSETPAFESLYGLGVWGVIFSISVLVAQAALLWNIRTCHATFTHSHSPAALTAPKLKLVVCALRRR